MSGDTFPGMSDADYFGTPALSHSDTKLLDPPARFRWWKDNAVTDWKPEYDFGHAVHHIVLGGGSGIDVIDAANWMTKAAKEARDASRAAGRAPLLVAEYERAQAAAGAVRTHPVAAKLLDNAEYFELACFWDDDGIRRKAKLDAVAGRFVIDLKTTQNADTEAFGRSAGKYGYATQAAWYEDAARACLGVADPAFLFICVESNPPHLVNVIQLDPYDVELGAKRNRQRIDLYRRCVETGEWPGYGDGINQAQLPRWAELELEEL